MTHPKTRTADLPDGYRPTELGPLPEEWRVVRLGEVASIGHSKRSAQFTDTIPFIPMALVPEDALYISRWEMRNRQEVRSGVVIREGDLLLAKITPCLENGKQGIVKGIPGKWGYATTEVFPIHVISRDLIIEYLALFMWQPNIKQILADKMEGTTGRQRLPKSVLIDFPIPLPPLAEQRAIAQVLRTVQGAREATERVIDAARELKKSLMRHLFTYGPVPVDAANRVPMQDTPIGPLPAHWRVVRLGEVAEVRGGKRLPKGHKFSEVHTPYPYIRVVDFNHGTIDASNLKYLTPADYQKIKHYVISSQDVYISWIQVVSATGGYPKNTS